MSTLAKMVEGIPRQTNLCREWVVFSAARTEVMQVSAAHVTPEQNTTQLTGSPDGVLENLSWKMSLGSHGIVHALALTLPHLPSRLQCLQSIQEIRHQTDQS